MSDWIEVKGESVAEAISKGLLELNANRSDVEVEVLAEPSKGIFGIIGAKEATIRIKVLGNISKINIAIDYLKELLEKMGINASFTKNQSEDGRIVTIDIESEDGSILIGKRGNTLNSLQYLVNIFINTEEVVDFKVILDTENYREKRKEVLYSLANKYADRAVRENRSTRFEPMNSVDRKTIHMALQDRNDVITKSDGNDPRRFVKILPNRKNTNTYSDDE